eukprot:TRINITY_DN1500_c0_g1_i5.p2 TRINITY_DN1500_c0_g1~~TRINITY_DN1500_c0_g1_i5.p2  ORF type:complete len:229 (-),score=29.04 TRINITY_DN1500_c0_g1_i5:526-1212(-)
MPLPRRRVSNRRLSQYGGGRGSQQGGGGTQNSRVTRIQTEEQWEQVMRRSQEKIVLVCYTTEFAPCRRSHDFLGDLAKDRSFRDVIFIELIADEFQQQAQDARIDRIPTCGFYYKGSFLEKVILKQQLDADVKQVYDRLKALLEKFVGIGKSGHYTWIKWLLGLAVTGGAIAAGTTQLMGKQRAASFSSKTEFPIQELDFSDSEWSDEDSLNYQQYLHELPLTADFTN